MCTDIPRQVRHSSVERRTVQFPDNSDLSDLNSFKTLMDLVLVHGSEEDNFQTHLQEAVQVPDQECSQVEKEECYSVPRQVAREECVDVPKQVERQECKNVPRQVEAQQCTDIPRQVEKQECEDVPRQVMPSG